MKNQLIALSALCAAGLITCGQAQNSPSQSQNSQGSSQDSSDTSSTRSQGSASAAHQKDWSGKSSGSGALSATGRSGGHQDIQASKLMGAEIKGSSGSSSVGTINDVIINPTSGRVDFALISLSSGSSSDSASPTTDNSASAGQTSPSSPSSRSRESLAAAGSTSSSGKLVAVPWTMLRAGGAYGSTATSSSGSQQSFVFVGDQTKLQSAPTFDPNTDFSQPSWKQSIYSHFGTSGTSTGGAGSPGGTSSSSSDSSSSDGSSSTSPQSSTSSPQSTGASSKP